MIRIAGISLGTCRYLVMILTVLPVCAPLSYAESLTGVVYSNEIGNGSHPAGRFELAVGRKVLTIDYGEPLERRFLGKTCDDIGAIWSVTVKRFADSIYASHVTCTGRVDDATHKSWLVVRDYLGGLPDSISRSDDLSSRYRSAPEFRRLVALVNSRDLSFYFSAGETSRCLKIVSIEPSKRARLTADCAVELQGKRAKLIFEVQPNGGNGSWEIDEINVD